MKKFSRLVFFTLAIFIFGFLSYHSYFAMMKPTYDSSDILLISMGLALIANIFKSFGD